MAMSPPQSWMPIPPPPGTQQMMYAIPNSEFIQYPSTVASATLSTISDALLDTPAYTPVQVRQNFTYAPAPLPIPIPQYAMQQQYPQVPPVQPTPMKKKKIEWPQSVRQYVQRSFDPSNMVPDVAKADMEAKLKETISAATDREQLYTIDWDNLPLPQQMIRTERAQAAVSWRPAQDMPIVVNGHQAPSLGTQSRKRKSQELNAEDDDLASPPPWRNTNNPNGFEGRITFQSPTTGAFDNRQDAPQIATPSKTTSKFQKNMEKRQRRFDGGYKSAYQRSPTPEAPTGPVVGKCLTLEKRYFRLTAPPNPDTVRPLHILRQTLELLKKKWKKEGNYSYICDQFKSLRQDLTVQHIKDKFTVEVYEIHARIALEKGDLGEYNQCQTQLRALYAQKLGGNPMEFKAYRILYFIHTCNRTALNDVMTDLTTTEKEDPAIKHALNARSALALGNYHKFFRLYLETPNMGAYLMDMFVVRERLAALSNICKA
jgi:hypothetical protein